MDSTERNSKRYLEETQERFPNPQPPKKKPKPIPKSVLAEQLKDWKSPVPPANVPAYRALYTGYKTRSRSSQQSASHFSLLEPSIEEQTHHDDNEDDEDSDFEENMTLGHRHASETQRVVWTRQEELILEHELRVNPLASFSEILERYKNEFHPSRTPKKLEAHYYHMKKEKEKEKRKRASQFTAIRSDQVIDPKKYNDIPIIYNDNNEDTMTHSSISYSNRPRAKFLNDYDERSEGEYSPHASNVNRTPRSRVVNNVDSQKNIEKQCKVVHYTLPNIKEVLKRKVPSHIEIPQRFSDIEEFLYDDSTTEIILNRSEPSFIQVFQEDVQMQQELRKVQEEYDSLLYEMNSYDLYKTNQSMGSLAILRGEKFKFPMNTREIFIGRATRNNPVDVDLSEALNERKQKISRIQAVIKFRRDGEFYLKNLGKGLVFVNGRFIERNKTIRLLHNCLIEFCGIPFIFEMNLVTLNTIRAELQKM